MSYFGKNELEPGLKCTELQAKNFHNRLVVYKGISDSAVLYQNSNKHRLKQTPAGSLRFYQIDVCAKPKTKYIIGEKSCDKPEQEFTFGKCDII